MVRDNVCSFEHLRDVTIGNGAATAVTAASAAAFGAVCLVGPAALRARRCSCQRHRKAQAPQMSLREEACEKYNGDRPVVYDESLPCHRGLSVVQRTEVSN